MKIQSSLLGELEFDENYIIHFPQGIPAFENEKEFILLPMAEGVPFYYLQSVNNSELCLLLAQPFTFFPDYEIDVDDEDLKRLKLKDESQLAVYLILTVPDDFKKTTANLLAPLLINIENRLGMQYVSIKTNYSTRHFIFRQENKNIAVNAAGGL
ncbi:flagellar assembly protein FliW [Syntrophomonas wolfei]|jgi:flagellar assembly factor FliW|uniref:flagellar assembly protein FliW n=1 Tax=Syntrophomonas wolfei TaxID=863 RepID=UPI000773ECD6|nr:flagellar assembly protein FliW [Syntrophomonas wolfei]